MQRKAVAIAMTAVGLTAAIAIPTIVFGNARSDFGSLSFQKAANTPLIAKLSGAVPPADLQGTGAAAITIDIFDSNNVTVADLCWDLSLSNIATPTSAHIHRVANGTTVVTFATPPPLAGCIQADPDVAQEIRNTPQNFYVDVHNAEFQTGAVRGPLSKGPPPAGEAHMLASPLRAYDSRDTGESKLAPNQPRPISLAEGKDGAGNRVIAVPPGATAAIVTMTVTETVAPGGFVKLYSAALTTPPATSSINWAGANQNLAVSTQVAVDGTSSVNIIGGGASTHVIIDVIGYLF